MKADLSKSLILAVLVIAGLAAGTSLLASYVDGPIAAPQAAIEAKCADCPRLNTDTCCKVAGVCANPQTCTAPCAGTSACTSPCSPMPCQSRSACCAQGKSQAAPCPASTGCPARAVTPCGEGGCAHVE